MLSYRSTACIHYIYHPCKLILQYYREISYRVLIFTVQHYASALYAIRMFRYLSVCPCDRHQPVLYRKVERARYIVTQKWHGIAMTQYSNVNDHLGHCSSAAPAVRWLPSAACAATPSFDVRSSGLFCGRPGSLELVTILSSWSSRSVDSFRRDLKTFLVLLGSGSCWKTYLELLRKGLKKSCASSKDNITDDTQ